MVTAWCYLLPPAYVVRGKVIFILRNVCLFTFRGGGVPCFRFSAGGSPMSQIFGGGGVPMSQIFRGGSHVSDFCGGSPCLRFLGGGSPMSQIFGRGSHVSDFRGGSQVSDFRGGGVPSLSKGKNFWHQFWLDTCSDWEKIFWLRISQKINETG